MSSAAEDAETLSIPSLAIVTILGYLIYRYFFSASTPSSTTTSNTLVSGPGSQRYRFTPAQVETVAGMFPQLNRRDIMWDLQRNGGSVQATTERVLGGRGLDTAPPSFQPQLPSTPTSPTDTRTSTVGGVASLLRGTTNSKKEEMDLITRYNLHARVKTSDKGKGKEIDANGIPSMNTNTNTSKEDRSMSGVESTTGGTSIGGAGGAAGGSTGANGWAPTKDARQSILQKRRDEMILEARRKMMERDAARGVSDSTSTS